MSAASTTKAAKRTPAKAAQPKPATASAKATKPRTPAKRSKPATTQPREIESTFFGGYTGAPSFGKPYDEMFDGEAVRGGDRRIGGVRVETSGATGGEDDA